MGFWWVVKRQAEIDPNKTYIIIGNHTSEIDIMMTLVMMKKSPFVFIGKARSIQRYEGLAFVLIYVAYIVHLVLGV